MTDTTLDRLRILATLGLLAPLAIAACGGSSTVPTAPEREEPDEAPQPSFDGEWTSMAELGGAARDRGVALTIGDRGYVGLGQENQRPLADFWEYDPETGAWTQKADFGGGARFGAAGFSIGTKGYVGTGFDEAHLADFWEYDPVTNRWSRRADFTGGARRGAVGFSLDGKGYLGTGSVKKSGGQTTDFWEYDPVSDAWTRMADLPGPKRYFAFSFALDFTFSDRFGDRGYIGGGWGEGAAEALQDLWIYDPATDEWSRGPRYPGPGRVWAAAFSISGKGYVGLGHTGQPGGSGGSNLLDDFWRYDPNDSEWTRMAGWPSSPRQAPVAFAVGETGYVGTGWDGNTHHRDLWAFTPPPEE